MSDDTIETISNNTKSPDDAVVNAAAGTPKTASEENDPVQMFVKSAEAAKQILAAMPEGTTYQQRMNKWVLGAIITLAGSLAYPCGAAVSTYASKKAERETAIAKRKADSENKRRKMQADLLKRIIVVAEKATLKNPNSIFQLGLIAQMVNENETAFGIQLEEAERTMKRMFDRLAPVSGLRTRLAEADALIADISRNYQFAKKHEKQLGEQLQELQQELRKVRYAAVWRRRQLQTEIDHKEQELVKHRVRRRFYERQLKKEEHFREFFKQKLAEQSKLLQQSLKDVHSVRTQLRTTTQETNKLIQQLQQHQTQNEQTKKLAQRLRQNLKAITDDYDKAKQAVRRMRSELRSERRELQLLRNNYATLLRMYRQLRDVNKGNDKPTKIKVDQYLKTPPAPTKAVRRQEQRTVPRPRPPAAMRRKVVDGLFAD